MMMLLLLLCRTHFVALRTSTMIGLQSLRTSYDSKASTVGRESPRAHIILKMEAASLNRLLSEVVYRVTSDSNELASPLAQLCGYIDAKDAPEYLHGVKQALKDALAEEARFVAELNEQLSAGGDGDDTRGLRRSTRATNKRARPPQVSRSKKEFSLF
jgi:hypothetical protein